MKKIFTFLMLSVLIFSLAACSSGAVESAAALIQAGSTSETASSLSAVAAQASAVGESAIQAASPAAGETSAASTALAENSETHDDADDYIWDSAAVIPITLSGYTISVDSAGVSVEGNQATIAAPGTYSLSGALADGQIIVNSQDEGIVRLI